MFGYRKYIPFISVGSGISRAEYETKDDYSRWQIDTSLTFRGKRCKTLNPDMLFSIFGRYSGDEPRVVRALMIKWIQDNQEAFDKATFIGMTGKDLELDSWLLNMASPRTVGDEFALYALCKLFNRHARVITRGNTWHTVSVEGTPDNKYVEDACDIHLLFIAKDMIAELKRRTTGGTPLLKTPTPTQATAGPLGHKNRDLPNVPVSKLPYETDDIVSSQGNTIPLPQSDVVILSNLLQNCAITDDPLIEPTKTKQTTPPTIPCSVKLRQLDAKDVTQWLPKPEVSKPLPDATPGTSNMVPETKLSGYNLRDHERKVLPNPMSNRPQRTVGKPTTYAEPTDESSQESHIIGTVYTLDSRPPPDSTTEKIIGLSEP